MAGDEDDSPPLSGTEYLLYSYGFVSLREEEKYDLFLPKSLISSLLVRDLNKEHFG
jgi:hypothetical protein